MTEETQPLHSPLGASSAERWMNCPGSVELIKHLKLEESDEPEYRANGLAAHEAAAHCLIEGCDSWEVVGQKFHEVQVEVEIADAIQIYLDTVRPLFALAAEAGKPTLVEYRISSPAHKDFYGTADAACILPGTDFHGQEILDVTDYKHGEGIMVEVVHNPQLMYYGYGLLCEYPEVHKVRMRIVQPRGFHADGPIREWEYTAEELRKWANDVLIPAMLRTEVDNDLDAGKWCRFCPAKLVCPLMTALYGAAMKANPAHIVNLSDEALGRSMQYKDGVKQYMRALEEETFNRLNRGREIPSQKLVHKQANRVFRTGAEVVFKKAFGEEAVTKPELKGPAAMEKINAVAKGMVKEWAYTPESGLTVVAIDDPRPGVLVKPTAEMFATGIAAANPDGLDIPPFLQRKAVA